MMKRSNTMPAAADRDEAKRYLKLVRRFPLRPLRSDADLEAATTVLDDLLDRGQLDGPEGDYLHVLGGLIREYEAEHYPIEPASDAEMLEHLIEARGMTQAEVAEGAGIAPSVISEVIGGKRRLSRNNIGRLASFFQVSPAVFPFETL